MDIIIEMLKEGRIERDLAFKLLDNLGYTYEEATHELIGGWLKVDEQSSIEEESIPEWMQGFEDLVYIKPIQECHLVVNELSEEQLEFIYNFVNNWSDDDHITFKGKWKYLYICPDGEWCLTQGISFAKKTSFNDLFTPKQ